MKTCDLQASATIELYFYNELGAAERALVEDHLRTCAHCRGAVEDLSIIRAALASRPDVCAPQGGEWGTFMARLDAAVRRQERATVPAIRSLAPRVRRFPLRSYLAAAALLALVSAATVYVARVRRAPSSVQTASTGTSTESTGATPGGRGTAERSDAAAFLTVSEQHFERSKLVVLGLATRNARDVSAEDWAHERQLASGLLNDTRLYRLAAEDRGMTGVASVMRDLELVLLQTSLAPDAEPERLEQIQRLIRKRDLVTKMDVMNATGL